MENLYLGAIIGYFIVVYILPLLDGFITLFQNEIALKAQLLNRI